MVQMDPISELNLRGQLKTQEWLNVPLHKGDYRGSNVWHRCVCSNRSTPLCSPFQRGKFPFASWTELLHPSFEQTLFHDSIIFPKGSIRTLFHYSVFLFITIASCSMSLFAQNKTVVGYYYDWYESTFPYTMIEYDKLSCIAEAFMVPNKDGSLSPESGATLGMFLYSDMINAAHQHNVKVVVSVGGYGNGTGYGFPSIAASATARANFART